MHSTITAAAVQMPSTETRLAAAQEQHVAELKALQERMAGEGAEARDALAAWKARPWWRRIAG